GNAIGGTGHFEVHVAEVIFVAEDVGENSETLALLHQTHRDTGYRRFQRHTSVHHRQTADAHRSHRAGAIRLGDFRHDANRVRELIALRQHRRQTATGETAVTDLATTRAAHAASFTNRVRREVVVQHGTVFALAFECVDGLRIACGTQCGNTDRLRFTAGKQRRAVYLRQQANLHTDRAHGAVVAAVDARLVVQDALAHDAGFQILEQVFDLVGRILGAFASELRDGLVFQYRHTPVTHLFFGDAIGFAELLLEAIRQRLHQRGVGGRRLPVPTRLAGFTGQLFDDLNDRLHFLV